MMNVLSSLQICLSRDASSVQTCSTYGIFLEDDNLSAKLCSTDCCYVSGRTSTDYSYIIFIFFLLCYRCCCLSFWFLSCRCISFCCLLRYLFSGFSDISHNCVNRDYISTLIKLSKKNSCCRRLNLHGSLICLDFHEHFAFFHFISNILQPLNDSTFFHVHIVLWHS